MDCAVPFCHMGCPLGNVIPEFNHQVYLGNWDRALNVLLSTNNFPEFTGRICPAPCEASCVLSINSDPVTIEYIEKEISDRAFESGLIRPEPPQRRTGKKVALVGSGPAGLAAAQQLNRAGHLVTVLERDEFIGGLLTLGIPDFKLDKSVVRRRVDLMAEEGISFQTGVNVGVNVSVADLLSEYDALCLTCGSTQARELDVPGRELNGIHLAMEYLTQQNRLLAGEHVSPEERITAEGKRVVILGGGDTGADCLGTAHRQGAEIVHQFELLARASGKPPRQQSLAPVAHGPAVFPGPRGRRDSRLQSADQVILRRQRPGGAAQRSTGGLERGGRQRPPHHERDARQRNGGGDRPGVVGHGLSASGARWDADRPGVRVGPQGQRQGGPVQNEQHPRSLRRGRRRQGSIPGRVGDRRRAGPCPRCGPVPHGPNQPAKVYATSGVGSRGSTTTRSVGNPRLFPGFHEDSHRVWDCSYFRSTLYLPPYNLWNPGKRALRHPRKFGLRRAHAIRPRTVVACKLKFKRGKGQRGCRVESGFRDLRTWVVYCAIYVFCFVGLSLFQWLYLNTWQLDNWVSTLADVASGSIGLALLMVISVEGVRAMVLFAPIIKKRMEEKARQEGRQEGRKSMGTDAGTKKGGKKGGKKGVGKTMQNGRPWLKRRDEAQANGQPFDEPSPSQSSVKDGGP